MKWLKRKLRNWLQDDDDEVNILVPSKVAADDVDR